MITSIKKWGNSQGLRFSKDILEHVIAMVYGEIDIES
jgi:antitoxin component of MazEF toxin-antitoxin module